MSDTAISVEGLGKLYLLGEAERQHESLLSELQGMLAAPFRNFQRLRRLDTSRASSNGKPESSDLLWALKDVSFEVKRGEVLGIIGRNGAGKSTLLKILSRITEPTRGRVRIHGRVASLLEVGTGFHQELTGRENIYLNGTILGMKRREIERKFDEIVAFSGVDRFLDTPVKRYSSGMRVRLAFAVAAHLDSEILIVDEVLAVGDHDFQRKCIQKMQSIVSSSDRAVFFVSHSMAAVQSLCTHGIHLQKGQIVDQGPVEEVTARYLATFAEASRAGTLDERADRLGHGGARLQHVYITDAEGRPTSQITSGMSCAFVIGYKVSKPLRGPTIKFTFYNDFGQQMMHFTTLASEDPPPVAPGQGEARCEIERLPLSPGSYRVNIAITDTDGMQDHLDGAMVFDVEDGRFFRVSHQVTLPSSVCLCDHRWSFKEAPVGA